MPQNVEIPANWAGDKLERWKQAQFLTTFVGEQYRRLEKRTELPGSEERRHFVLNINSPWGYGKTFFLQRWKKDLEERHLVLEFNAWSNDYSKDPLVSFLAEIARQLVEKLASEGNEVHANAERWENLKAATGKLLKSVRPHLVRRIAIATASAAITGIPYLGPVGGEDEGPDSGADSDDKEAQQAQIGKTIDAVVDFETNSLFSDELARKKAIEEFQNSLKVVIDSISENQGSDDSALELPVFILIDELDRCRPDFTIELLEVVKHIFNVDDVFFVFGTDGQQLQAALEGTYGAAFNAETYFQRIFTREVQLKEPDHLQFALAMMGKHRLFRSGTHRGGMIPVASQASDPVRIVSEELAWFSEAFGLTLREQDHLVATLDNLLILRSGRRQDTMPALAIFLIILWQNRKSLLDEFKNDPRILLNKDVQFPLEDRLKQYFPRFTLRPTVKVAFGSGTDMQEKDLNMCDFINAVASVANLSKTEVFRFTAQGNTYDFMHQLGESMQKGRGVADLRMNSKERPVMAYLDDIILSGG